MKLPRRREDEAPFATEGTGGTDVSRAFGGEALAHIVDGDVKNRFKRRVRPVPLAAPALATAGELPQ